MEISLQTKLKRPWYKETSSPEENERARQAYRALMTVTLLKPDSPEYRTFTEEVRARALRDYEFSYRDSERRISQQVSNDRQLKSNYILQH
ncbi:unnamed protein product [Schistosoma margrebowiei]|uniref:Uncharacterized protein n=1 Tax=Schistosoma margrebowiei TaxID=48269 RepID=A0A183LJC5_9TREM|nr:unnamed protein product [Schistosoma margrebowiei]